MDRSICRGVCTWVGVVAVAVSAGQVMGQPERGGGSDRGYRAGIGLLNKGMYEPAAKELEAFLRANPGSAEATAARYGLAVCHSRMEKHERAAEELEIVLKDEGFELRDDAALLRGHSLIAVEREDEAAVVLEELLGRRPAAGIAGRAALLLGEMRYRAGEFAKARENFATARGACEGAEQARATLFLGLSTLGGGDARSAAQILSEVPGGEGGELAGFAALGEARARHELGEMERAIGLYERAAQEGSEDVRGEAYIGLVRVHRERGELERATDVLARAARDPGAQGFAGILGLEHARVLLDGGDAGGAAGALDQLAGRVQEELADDVAYWRGKCELRRGENVKAAELLGRAAERYARSELLAEIEFDHATALTRAERLEEARAAWNAWLTRHEGHAMRGDAAAALAGCAFKQGDFEACIRVCEAEEGGAARAEILMLMAEAERGLGNLAEAARSYERVEQRAMGEKRAGEKGAGEKAGTAGDIAWRARVRRGEALIELGRGEEGARVLEAALREGAERGGEDAGVAGVRAAGLGTLGEYLMQRERWVEAAACFERLAGMVKGSAAEGDALLRQGLALSKGGDAEGAAVVLERAAREMPASAAGNHARFELGQILVAQGKDGEAKGLFEEVVERERGLEKERPLTGHAIRQLAGIASRAGDPKGAAALLGSIDGGGSVGDRFSRASALMAAGEYEGAAREYEALMGMEGAGERAAEAAAMRGIAINRLGRHVEAIAELRRVDLARLAEGVAGAVRYEIALALKLDGKRDEAVSMFEALVGSEGGGKFAAFGAVDAAQMYCEGGKFDRAAAVLERGSAAIAGLSGQERRGLEPRAAYLRGLSLLRLGNASGALAALEGESLRGAEGGLFGHARIVRGEALLAAGRGREAAEVFEEVVKSPVAGANMEVVQLRIGEAWASVQAWEKSEGAYAAFLKAWPASELWFQAKFGQGWALEQRAKHEGAIAAYREVVEKHEGPTAARAQFQIGECLYAQRKFEEAAAELLKVDVLYAYPEWSSAAIYEAGRCLMESGKRAEAVRQFDEVIERFGDTSWAKLAKEQRELALPEDVPGRERTVSGKDASVR